MSEGSTARDWKIKTVMASVVRRAEPGKVDPHAGTTLVVQFDSEALIVTAMQMGSAATTGTNEERMLRILSQQKMDVVGTGKDLCDAMRIANEYLDQWENAFDHAQADGDSE